jgi:hypothetical protein
MEPVTWSEDVKWQDQLLIEASSYNDWVLSVFPMFVDWKPEEKGVTDYTKVGVGEYFVYVRKFPKTMKVSPYRGLIPSHFLPDSNLVERRASLDIYYGSKIGKVSFTDEVLIPVMASSYETWMSLTPMEIMSQRTGVKRSKGNVLIGGLGMGWFAMRCLERKQVKSVTVYERNIDVIDFFGQPLVERFGDRIQFVCDDAYNAEFHKYDSILFDIWPDISGKYDDRRWEELTYTYPKAWGWGYKIYSNSMW